MPKTRDFSVTKNELLVLFCEVRVLQDYSENNMKPRTHFVIKAEIFNTEADGVRWCVCVCVCVCVFGNQ